MNLLSSEGRRSETNENKRQEPMGLDWIDMWNPSGHSSGPVSCTTELGPSPASKDDGP